jgi:hypothetical protein
MDIEVVEAIESLRGDIRRVETSLRAEFGNGIGQLRAEVATRVEIASMREELIRHSDIRFESLRDDIRILAEGFAWLGTKIDSLRPPVS